MPAEVRLLKYAETRFLSQVIDLADNNRAYLGFMPEQAFGPFARNGQIIIAVENEQVIGYLLYRLVSSKQSAAIVHLCIDANARGRNIPEQLFKFLKSQVKNSLFISLKCRRDFAYANRMWNRLNFIPRNETKGRSADGKLLTNWYFSLNNQLELFEKPFDDEKINVIIDANVFFDLTDNKNVLIEKESHSLTADWLLDDVNLCITDEIYREINRNDSASIRNTNRKAARKYRELKYDLSDRDSILAELKEIIPRKPTLNNLSDLTHLANSIAAKVRYFITQDGATVDQSQTLSEKYGLLVRRPVDLVIDIDELKNNNKYVEARFVEHKTLFAPIKALDIPVIVHEFVSNKTHEKIKELRNKLRLCISNPNEYTSELWKGKGAGNIPHFAVVWHQNNLCIEINFLRCKEGFSRLVERKIKSLILAGIDNNINCIKVSDQHISDVVKSALIDYRFFWDAGDNCWYKFMVSGVKQIKNIIEEIGSKLSEFENLPESLNSLLNKKDLNISEIFESERFLWPGKISEAKVPCYIVPIQPRWARSLFEEKTSNSDLFGFDASLLLSRRNVYYRAARPRIPLEGRILWYISKDSKNNQQGYIGACSYVDKVTISTAKALFKKYESLGTYKWIDIYTLAKENSQMNIMAFEFSDTELFKKQLSFASLQTFLADNGRKHNQIAAPVEISQDFFMMIYTSFH